MNTSTREDDFAGQGGGGIENVSRSGRVRKKNTLLAGFESLDQLEKPKKKPEKRHKEHSPAKVTLKFGGESVALKKPPGSKKSHGKRMKISGPLPLSRPHHQSPFSLHEEGDLEIDLPPGYEDDMPILAAEEIIDESLLDADDSGLEIHEHSSNSKLKSQAQSTYMMEKSFEKNRKNTTNPNGSPGKMKATRKDKGNPRVTAYMLWAKDQRAVFGKKYPHLDFSSLSKKLSDLWATVPQNQKKMWKNKAAKIMRKNSNVMENIKNSGPLPPVKGKKSRGRPRIHPVNSDSDGPGSMDHMQIMPPHNSNKNSHSAGKSPVRKIAGNFLPQSEKKVSPSTSSSAKPNWRAQQKQNRSPKSNSNNNVGFGPPKASNKPRPKVQLAVIESKPVKNNNLFSATPSTSFSLSSSKQLSPRKEDDYKVTGTAPMDVAAHFALLGESLSIIGERLKDVEGQTVSGSLSVLLDSLLCATGPLLCLSQQVPELNCIPQERLAHLLDNIAFIMPGL